MVFSRFFKSLNPVQREKIHFRIALLYAALAWNGFAIGIYLFTRDKKEISGISRGLKTLSTSDTNTAQLIRFKGFNIVENTIYDKKQIDEIRQNILNPPVEEESHDFD
ncbi:PREDICTED: uncharacterized protein LOC107068254 [Polistes dominula]|uniref:Uncharacterized protein LOC107068254 n=1 Tax=Polistes dominula TaxID=743375 RepID=A0ABM1IIB8_POLDO|nr:PREDICTED: uncharacterized protein LOC107068254 [Polistes dominula]XP_015179955.1 PREDICTED: uncharacterized protein LOC107068254 [Polistes dominula]